MPQPAPAGLGADDHAPTVADEGGDLRAGPEPAVIGAALQRLEQRRLLLGRELGSATVGPGAAIDQAGGPLGIPPLQHGADPTGGQPDLLGGLGRGQGLLRPGQEPEDLPVGLLPSEAAGAVAAGDLLGRQMGKNRQSWVGHKVILRACTTSILGLAIQGIPYDWTLALMTPLRGRE